MCGNFTKKWNEEWNYQMSFLWNSVYLCLKEESVHWVRTCLKIESKLKIKINLQIKFKNANLKRYCWNLTWFPFISFFDFKQLYCQISSALKGPLEKVQHAWCEYMIMHVTWEYLRTITLLHKSNQPGTSSSFGKSLHHNLKG